MQYSTKTKMENEAFNELFERTKELFDKLKKEIEQ